MLNRAVRKPGVRNIPSGWGTRHPTGAGVKRLPKYTIPEIASKYKIDEQLLYNAFLMLANPPKPCVTNRAQLHYYEAKEVVQWFRKGETHAQFVLRCSLQQQVE